jgi:hypothetical protein
MDCRATVAHEVAIRARRRIRVRVATSGEPVMEVNERAPSPGAASGDNTLAQAILA